MTRTLAAVSSCLRFFVQVPVNSRDLLNPRSPLGMLERQDGVVRPMKVEGDEGYLLIELLEGIA
jgi:hypothetical protein